MKHLPSALFAGFLAIAFVAVSPAVSARAQEVSRGSSAGASGASGASASPSAPQLASKPDKALRIFLKTGAKKTYVRGYQWLTLDLNRKISLVESARRGALQIDAIMLLPAERYVYEVNKFFQSNPSMLQMELGQVIQGIAISLKDWEQGGMEN